MKAWRVRVEIRPWQEGGYIAEVPSLQGCWVVAPTVEEAIRDIQEGIEMSIASRLKRGEPLPADIEEVHAGEGQETIHIDVAVAIP